MRALATVGGATGGEFSLELRQSGVPHTLIPVAAATRRSIALVDEALGDTTIVNERGINPSGDEWRALFDALGETLVGAEHPSVLVISGSMPPETAIDILPSLILVGRAAGARVIVDTSGPALLQAAESGASVLKPNAAELADATGLDDPIAGARELLNRGVELVLLSLGADGMLAVTQKETIHARLDTALAGNPTGAGDAAVAACAVLMAEGINDPETILRRATAWSASAVLMPLAGELSDTWPALEAALTVAHYTPKD